MAVPIDKMLYKLNLQRTTGSNFRNISDSGNCGLVILVIPVLWKKAESKNQLSRLFQNPSRTCRSHERIDKDLLKKHTNPRYYGAGYLILFNFEKGDDIPQIGSLIFLGTMVIMNIENCPDRITHGDLLLFSKNCPTWVYGL